MHTASFKNIVEGGKSLLEWIIENSDENGLDKLLPDEESVGISSEIGVHFADGMLDNIVGTSGDDSEAQALFDIFVEFAKIPIKDLSDTVIDAYLGRIYLYTMQHRTLGYIDRFIELFLENVDANERLATLMLAMSKQFLIQGIHREVIKFALLIFGLFNLDDEELKIYAIFGCADEFALFVAAALERADREDLIFFLAKKTRGWGRIAYIERLEVYNDEVREWLIFEGYKNNVGVDHIVLEYLEKSDLLGYIKQNGFSEKLYDVTSDIINSFCGMSKVSFGDYKDSKELITVFVQESKNQKMNLERFSNLCDLVFYIKDGDKEEGEERTFSDEECESLLAIIGYITFEKGIDWEGLVRSNPTNYHARNIAKILGFDIWEDIYKIAKRNQHFDEWYALSLTDDKERYKRLCELAKERFDLDSLKKEPKDELGLSKEFEEYLNLEMIAQNLSKFDEIIGLEIIETLLQSPVTRSRNIALRVIESYKEIPQSIIEILEKNKAIEPNKDVLERYEKILKNYKETHTKKAESKLRLQVWAEYYSSGIWILGKEDPVSNVSYEYLGLPEELAAEFKDWQDTFDKYGLRWCEKNLTKLDKDFESLFYAKGLELAKKLKMFFKHKAYVEYVGLESGEVEIKYYYVMSDYNCYLWTEEDVGLDLEDSDEFGVKFDEQKMKELHKELEKWSLECFELEWDDKHNYVGAMTDDLIERGKALTQKLQDFLPAHYCVEFRE